MKKPNFFIIGAPKCGTTSLANWLSEHSQVYFSPRKEPHFFSDIYPSNDTLEDYEKLFENASESHKAVGEGSTSYLYSEVAVPRIINYQPEARFIVLLRNPIEMCYSLHEEELFRGHEHIINFETAWNKQAYRNEGKEINFLCANPKLLLYGSRCKLGDQLKRLYMQVANEKILILLLEDIKKDPRREYLRILDFLGLNDDGRTNFPAKNSAKRRKSLLAHRILKYTARAKKKLGIENSLGLFRKVDSINTTQHIRPPLSYDMYEKLVDYFYEDITELEKILKRDLSHWYRVE